MKIKNLANYITALRIVGTLILFFLPSFSISFFIVYTLTGLTDALDGFVARKTKSESPFGAKLDSVSDLVFYAVMLILILPTLIRILPFWIWFGVGFILFLRIVNYITVFIRFRRFPALHTYLNKLSGLTIFFIPYSINFSFCTPFCIGICLITLLSVTEELIIHLKAKEYPKEMRSIFFKKITEPTQ